MNYGEIVEAVLVQVPITNREAYVRDKVNQIIRYISASGHFWRDVQETTIGSADGVDAAAKVQSIAISSLVRKLIYLRYTDEDETTQIKCIDLRDLVGRENCIHMDNVAYVSGSSLHIKHSILTPSFNIGYYSHPAHFLTDGSEDTESNWITDLVPGLVIDLASSYLLNLKGDKEDANGMASMANMLKSTYIRDFVDHV